MADLSWNAEQHYELYKERCTSATRYAFLTFLFTLAALFKVIDPFVDLTGRTRLARQELTRLETEMKGLERERAQLQEVQTATNGAMARIRSDEWSQRAETLVRRFQDLRAAFGHAETGAKDSLIRAAELNSMGREMIQSTPNLPMPSGGAERSELDAAVGVLRLTPQEISAKRGTPGWGDFLRDRYLNRAGEEADRAVEEAVRFARVSLVGELRQTLDIPGARELVPGLEDGVKRLEVEVSRWRTEHLGERTWYDTVPGKFSELGKLDEAVSKWKRAAMADLEKAGGQLDEKIRANSTASEAQRRAVQDSTRQEEELTARLDRVLPEWLAGLVSPAEMVQLFPFAILVLVTLFGHNAWRLRGHYLALQRELPEKERERVPLRSVWMLAPSAPGGVTGRLLVHVLGVVLLWVMFESGMGKLESWSPDDPAAKWQVSRDALDLVAYAGRVVFALAIGAALFAALRREGPAPAPHGGPNDGAAEGSEGDAKSGGTE